MDVKVTLEIEGGGKDIVAERALRFFRESVILIQLFKSFDEFP
jgi:hypothetical protein